MADSRSLGMKTMPAVAISITGKGTIAIHGGFGHRLGVAWKVLWRRPLCDDWGFDADTAENAIEALREYEASRSATGRGPVVKHFLVERDRTGLRKITVYEDGGEAYEAFTERERDLYPWRTGVSTSKHPEVVLLGADSLSACIATHSSWFDEAADPMDLFQPALKGQGND